MKLIKPFRFNQLHSETDCRSSYGSAVSPNITVQGDPDKCDTEAVTKKVRDSDDHPGIIHNIRQRSYGNLAIRNDQDVSKRNTIDEDPLNNPMDVQHFRLKVATIIQQSKGNIQVAFRRTENKTFLGNILNGLLQLTVFSSFSIKQYTFQSSVNQIHGPPNNFFFENALKKNYRIFSQISYFSFLKIFMNGSRHAHSCNGSAKYPCFGKCFKKKLQNIF